MGEDVHHDRNEDQKVPSVHATSDRNGWPVPRVTALAVIALDRVVHHLAIDPIVNLPDFLVTRQQEVSPRGLPSAAAGGTSGPPAAL